LDEQFALAPASSKNQFHNAFPGGLVEHSLRVLANGMKLVNAYEFDIPKESLIISCLFHDVGKVGIPEDDGTFKEFYIQQNDQWRADKLGEQYAYNNDIQYMSTPQRSVFLMQSFGIKLKQDEYLSILLNDGFVVEENRRYCLKINPLVYVVQTADYISTMQEKKPGDGKNYGILWNK